MRVCIVGRHVRLAALVDSSLASCSQASQEATQGELDQVRVELRLLQAKHPAGPSFVSNPGPPSAALTRYCRRSSSEQQQGIVIELHMATDMPGVLRRTGAEMSSHGSHDAAQLKQLIHLLRALGVFLHAGLVKEAVRDALRPEYADERCDSLPQMVAVFDNDSGPLCAFLYSLVSGVYEAPSYPGANTHIDVARVKAGVLLLFDHVLRLSYPKVKPRAGPWFARLVTMADGDRALRQFVSVGLGASSQSTSANLSALSLNRPGSPPGSTGAHAVRTSLPEGALPNYPFNLFARCM